MLDMKLGWLSTKITTDGQFGYDLCRQASQFQVTKGVQCAYLRYSLSIFSSVTALLDAFNKEKALVGAFSEYCESYCEIV